MTCFIATLVVKPGKEQEFERLQQELSQLTHEHEPDTLVYDVLKQRDSPSTYLVYGRFRDEAAFQAHQATPFHDRLVPPILACLARDMELTFLDWKS